MKRNVVNVLTLTLLLSGTPCVAFFSRIKDVYTGEYVRNAQGQQNQTRWQAFANNWSSKQGLITTATWATTIAAGSYAIKKAYNWVAEYRARAQAKKLVQGFVDLSQDALQLAQHAMNGKQVTDNSLMKLYNAKYKQMFALLAPALKQVVETLIQEFDAVCCAKTAKNNPKKVAIVAMNIRNFFVALLTQTPYKKIPLSAANRK